MNFIPPKSSCNVHYALVQWTNGNRSHNKPICSRDSVFHTVIRWEFVTCPSCLELRERYESYDPETRNSGGIFQPPAKRKSGAV